MTLGDRVEVTSIYEREQSGTYYWVDKEWKEYVIKPRVGIYIGWRILQDGTRGYDPEEGYNWEAKKHFKAAVVVFNERQNPIYVPIGALKNETQTKDG
jgi:hypothetical protein